MQIGFIGLGKMGGGMSARLASMGHNVHGFAPSPETREKAQETGVVTHESREDLINALESPKVVWLMIPDRLVNSEVNALIPLLSEGDVIIDGGNTHFKLASEHSRLCTERGIKFLDIGVSGGLVGATQGYSMMAGGNKESFIRVEPVIKDMCQPGGYGYFGAAGAGHFLKMVHNGIEYGLMEAYAEGFDLINSGPFENVDLGQLANVWQNGAIVQSFINSLAVDIFTENRNLDGIEGKVNMLGEGQWTLDYANEIGVDLWAIKAAIDRRLASQNGNISFATKYLAATRNAFGGHSLNKTNADNTEATKNV